MGRIDDDELPPELLTRISTHLANRREDIAACRLVCQYFKGCSSGFLVPRVVVAKRFDVIQRLWEVMEHPYFRQHVTEVVYDASVYDESAATDFEEYVHSCQGVYRRPFYDEDASDVRHVYAAFYDHVCKQKWPLSSNGWEYKHMAGVHKGFLDYFRQWLEQSRMIEDALYRMVLKEVLVRLPKLRRIVFTDFRALTMDGESHRELCVRLFGSTLQPLQLSFPEDPDFFFLLDIIASTPKATIRSLWVGGRPYESPRHSLGSWESVRFHGASSTEPSAFPWHMLIRGRRGYSELVERALGKLQQLRLPISFLPDQGLESMLYFETRTREST